MNDAVKIAVRRRPLTPKETADRENVAEIDQLDEKVLMIDDKHFVFDKIIEPEVSQESIYLELIEPMVQKFLRGFHCTVLAYGQTGTGKTFTMGLESEAKDDESAGMIPRALADIFKNQKENSAMASIISVAFIEIYVDKVYDLLSNSVEQINIKGQRFTGPKKRRVFSLADAQQALVDGNKKRHVRPTQMNSNSSRSHAIFTIKVEKQSGGMGTRSELNLVDLAGSEGVRRTNHQGTALNEGVHINQGLLCISRVMKALSQRSQVIPYRESVLSSVLQDSLNEKSYLTLMACISPLHKDLRETITTLNFAHETKKIKITPQINAMIMTHKKNKTPVKFFKTPVQRKFVYRPGPLAQSTAVKRSQIPRRSDSFTQSDRYSSFSNVRENTRAECRTKSDRAKLSGCSALELSMNSTCSEPLPAIQKIQQFANSQPPTRDSPIIRKVLSVLNIKQLVVDEIDERMKTMHNMRTLPLMIAQQAVTEDVPRNNLSDPDSEKTILLSQEMEETPIIPTEPEGICTDGNVPENAMEITELNPRTKLVPYDISTDDSTLDITDFHDLTVQKLPPPISTDLPNKNEVSKFDSAPPPVIVQSGPHHLLPATMSNIESPHVDNILRRSRRLTILNERKEAQAENENSKNESAALRHRRRPSVFKDVTNKMTNAVNTKKRDGRKNALKVVLQRVTSANQSLMTYEIAKTWATETEAKKAHRQGILNILNTGDLNQIQMLPQIGAKTAYSLLTTRNLYGPYKDIESLAELKFWSGKRYEKFLACNNLK